VGCGWGRGRGGEPVERHFNRISLYLRSVGVIGGEGVPVDHAKETFVFILHEDPRGERSHVVAEVERAGHPHPAEHALTQFGCRSHSLSTSRNNNLRGTT